jgi:aminoglycoside phosphotransferase (APT) family kinase protein
MAAVQTGLAQYFTSGLERLRITGPAESHRERVSRLLSTLRSRISLLRPLSDESILGAPALDHMAHVWQHGDFWLGNFGIGDGRLIVFDWEDLGVATLHGHDLGVFIASALRFDAGAVRRLADRRQPAVLDAIVGDFCTATGVEREVFFALLPVFLTEFLALKLNRDYSSLAINLVADLLMTLAARGPQ